MRYALIIVSLVCSFYATGTLFASNSENFSMSIRGYEMNCMPFVTKTTKKAACTCIDDDNKEVANAVLVYNETEKKFKVSEVTVYNKINSSVEQKWHVSECGSKEGFLYQDGVVILQINIAEDDSKIKKFLKNGKVYKEVGYYPPETIAFQKDYRHENSNGESYIGYYDENGEKNGVWVSYGLMGLIAEKQEYKNGVLHGDYVRYINENMAEEGKYLDGKKDGKWISIDHYPYTCNETIYNNGKEVSSVAYGNGWYIKYF
jgi:hypothetical protein